MNLTVEFDEAYAPLQEKPSLIVNLFQRRNFDAIVLMYNFEEFAYQDALMDLSELLPQYAPKLYANITEFEQKFASYNGKLLAVPSHGYRDVGMYFAVRSDIAKRCGITQVSTIEDISKALKIIKEKESIPPIYSKSLSESLLMRPARFFQIEGPFWYREDDPDMRILPYEQFEEYSRASELYREWKNAGYFTESIDEAASFVTTGLGLIDYYRKGKLSDNYELFELYPSEGMYLGTQEMVYGIAINKNSKKAHHVLRFLEWIYSDRSNYDLIMYGIEGKNYTLKNDYIIPDKENGLTNWYGSEAFLRYDFERLQENDPELVKRIYKEISNVEYQFPPHYGFIPDISKFWDELQYARYSAKSFKIKTDVFEGTSDMTISEYIQYQKDLGSDDIAKELQTQLNEWLSKNK